MPMPEHSTDYVYNQLKARNFVPKEINVQISRRCNLNCYMCGWEVWGRNKGNMPMEMFQRVVRQAAEFGIPKLAFTAAQGEPLLNNRAEEYIHMALDAGFKTSINTNCTTLGDRNIAMLVKAAKRGKFTVQASFSGYDKASHEDVYVGSRFEDTSRKLATCYRAFLEAGLDKAFTINGIIKDSQQRHKDYLLSIGIDPDCAVMHRPDNFAGIVKVGVPRKGGVYSHWALGELHLCPILAHKLVVYDDGQVSACACRDSENIMNIGNIMEETLFMMRWGSKFQRFVDAFLARDISGLKLCSKCDIPYDP